MAFQYRVAYRFTSGLVEGFVGTSLVCRDSAYLAAMRKIKNKCKALDELFNDTRVIHSFDDARDDEEREQIRSDWLVSEKSDRT